MTSGCRALTSHITSRYAGILIPATNDMTMPGFPASVAQFLVIQSPKDFTRRPSRPNVGNGERMGLFHGTDLSVLPAILQEGLKATSRDAVGLYERTLWMAEEPATSYHYAGGYPDAAKRQCWKDNSYANRGVLLGCELLGTRKGDQDHEHSGDFLIGRPQPVHIFGSPNTSLVKVRCVFILPWDTLDKGYSGQRYGGS